MKTLIPILFTILISSSVAQNPYTQYADMLSERFGHSMCVLDGKIYALGGAITYLDPAYQIMFEGEAQ